MVEAEKFKSRFSATIAFRAICLDEFDTKIAMIGFLVSSALFCGLFHEMKLSYINLYIKKNIFENNPYHYNHFSKS